MAHKDILVTSGCSDALNINVAGLCINGGIILLLHNSKKVLYVSPQTMK